MMQMRMLCAAMAALGLLFGAATASAQVQVMYQSRFFESFGDGSTNATSVPCCVVHTQMTTGGATITVPGTFDTRTTGPNMGAYLAEYGGRTKTWYGTYDSANGNLTLPAGNRTTATSTMLISPGGNLLALTTSLMRTVNDLVLANGGGPGNFTYTASLNNPTNTPTFRTSATFTTPSNSGRLVVTAGPNQYGGTRDIVHEQLSAGFVPDPTPGLLDQFVFPVANGPGVPFTGGNVVRRETRSAPFFVRAGSFSGTIVFSALGTGWFTILPYTTGMVTAFANTIGTPIADHTVRTETGFNSVVATTMGGATGQLQLVSAHLLQSRGATITNLAGSNIASVTFMPEPGSAALIGAGVLGLIGMVANDRRKRS